MNSLQMDAHGIVDFTRLAHTLLADLINGRIADQAESVRIVREKGERIAFKTEDLAVKAFIQRTMEDLEFYQAVPYKNGSDSRRIFRTD